MDEYTAGCVFNDVVGIVCRTTPLLDEKQDEGNVRRDERSVKLKQLLMRKVHDHVAAEKKVRTALAGDGISISTVW